MDSGSAHLGSDAAENGSDLCPDVPDMMEDSDVRTVNWLMQTGDDDVGSEGDDESLDQKSDVAQTDSVLVTASGRTAPPALGREIALSAVHGAEYPTRCTEDVVPSDSPDADLTPPLTAHSDSDPPGFDPLVNDAPDTAIPDYDCPVSDIPGPLAQVYRTWPGSRVLRDCRSIRPPRRLICEMNDQVVGEDSVSSVSVSSLVQFFSTAFSV